MTSSTKPTEFYADFAGLASLKGAAKNQDPKALREAARQFESLFTQMMLKSMRQASDSLPGGESLMDNDQSKMYLEMFDNQLSLQLSKGRGLGLADVLVKQLSPRGLVTDAPIASKSNVANPGFSLPVKNSVLTNTSQSGFELAAKSHGTVFPVPKASTSTAPVTTLVTAPVAAPAIQVTPSSVSPAALQKCTSAAAISMLSPNAETPVWTPTAAWQLPLRAAAFDSVAASQPVATTPSVPPVDKITAKETLRPQPLARNAAEFVRQLWPHAQKAARELGVDAKTLIAHAALETGWGKFVPCNPDGTCSFNLFGIKATNRWRGGSTAVNTLEYEGGIAVKKRESFRTYESPADSFRDYASFIKNSPRYAAAVGVGGDAAAFAAALQQGGYATDPNYATKLASVAARLQTMGSPTMKTLDTLPSALKLASAQPLTTGRSVSSGNVATGDET